MHDCIKLVWLLEIISALKILLEISKLLGAFLLKNRKAQILKKIIVIGGSILVPLESWNKDKKRPDSIRKCIGKLNPETNEIISSKQKQSLKPTTSNLEKTVAIIKIIGSSMLLDYICEKTGLATILKKSFPEHWKLILSLAYFQTIEGKALSRVEHWSETHLHPHKEYIDNRRVSELLPTITEEKQMIFFKNGLKNA